MQFLWREINNDRDNLILKYIDIYIQEENINPKWKDVLKEFVIKAVNEVKPSTVELNDSMSFNDYVTVVNLPWGDKFDSEYIPGVVL